MTLASTNCPLFQAIDKQHQQMEELFLLHQEALLLAKLPLAKTMFTAWKDLQIAHLSFENNHLLVELEHIKDTRWPHTLYLHEHNKITDLLDKAEQALSQTENQPFGATSGQAFRRWLIERLEQHKSLKNVLEHHEQREQQGMLAELGEHLSSEKRSQLSQQLLQDTQSALDMIYDNSSDWLKALEDT